MIHHSEFTRQDGALVFTVRDNDRTAIASSIERLIDLLDTMEADADFEVLREDDEESGDMEPSFGHSGQYCNGKLEYELELDGADDEDTLGAPEHIKSHLDWYNTTARDECEDENEHGGNVVDEPHDGNDEGL